MLVRNFIILGFLLAICASSFSQATLPLSRTTWSTTPVGWTDNFQGTTYTSTLTCDGNSNRARLDATGDGATVFFTGVPNILSFDLQGNSIGATSSLLVEESPDGVAWSTLSTISGISGSCVTYTFALQCTSAYARWTYTKVTGNLALDNVSINATTCGSGNCPVLTGAILNSCDNGVAGCNEGDAEIIFMNTGSYSITVSSLPANVVNYYGSTTSFTTPTIDAYTGTFTTNASATSALNASSGCTGNFIDAANAGTIPANATVMMVPSSFCGTNYDFSALCSSFSPIYVLYFNMPGWNTGGNLANYQTPAPKPKYLTLNMSSVNAGCGMQYYTYDANSEVSGNGAGVSYTGSISTNSATPTSPDAYTAATCTVPIVLPIDLVSFTVKRTYTYEAELNFTTLGEENILRFAISKSYDAVNYYTVGEQEAHNQAGTFNYTQYDAIGDETAGIIYYRLVEIDLNGLKTVIGNCLLDLRPDKEINVTFNEDDIIIDTPGGLRRAELFSADGRLIQAIEGNENELRYKMNIHNCAKGFYLLSLTDVFGNTSVKKVAR